MKKRDHLKLDRYLNRNRVEPLPAPLALEYSSLPPRHGPSSWRMALQFALGVGTRLAIAFAGLGVAVTIGVWQEPATLAGIVLIIFSVLLFMVFIAMLRQ